MLACKEPEVLPPAVDSDRNWGESGRGSKKNEKGFFPGLMLGGEPFFIHIFLFKWFSA
jgi:hypothetical protein